MVSEKSIALTRFRAELAPAQEPGFSHVFLVEFDLPRDTTDDQFHAAAREVKQRFPHASPCIMGNGVTLFFDIWFPEYPEEPEAEMARWVKGLSERIFA